MINISQFDDNFRLRLTQEIREIEKNTLAEVVVIVRARSHHYRDISLLSGFAVELITLAYLLFSPQVFNPYWICFAGVMSFVAGFFLVELISPLKRILIPRKRRRRMTEIYARAIFQKAGICYTRENTGLLVFVSLLERRVLLIPDKGLLLRIPQHLWEEMEKDFNGIFSEEDIITEALLSKLAGLRNVLNRYVPPVENDVNELPDDLDIDL